MTLINIIRNSRIYAAIDEALPAAARYVTRELEYNLSSLLEYRRTDMFASVSIETTSRCNRRCNYCPNSDYQLRSQRPQKEMDEGIFAKIIRDLAAVKYRSKIVLGHYGEPLLDDNLERIVTLTKEKLPQSYVVINTNGDYLTPERFESLIVAGVDKFSVTNHNPNGEPSPPIETMKEYLEQNPSKKKYFHLRPNIRFPSTRANLVKVPQDKARTRKYCINESHTLTIDVKGNVVLCSEDYLAQETMGNVRKQKIMHIWNSEEFRKVRRVKKRGRFIKDICKECTSG